MSVAFEIEVTRSRRVRRLHALTWAVPALGLALASSQVASGPTLLLQGASDLRIALAGAVLVGVALLARQAWRELSSGSVPCPGVVLNVDDAGEATLSQGPGQLAVASRLAASCRLPGLILLVLSPSAPGSGSRSRASTVTLLSGRDGLADDDWRRLNVWLRWMERGRHTPPSS